MREGVCVLDGRGRTTFANLAAARLTGYAPEELVGGIHHDALEHSPEAGDPYSTAECPLCGAFLRGEPRGGKDVMFRCKDGSRLLIGYSSDPMKRDGEVVGAVIVFRGLSGRGKRDEGALKRDVRIARLTEDDSMEGLVLSEDGRVFDANRAFLEMFGYELDQVLGMASAGLVLTEDRELVGRQVSSGSAGAYEAWGLRKDGTTFPVEVRSRQISFEGRRVQVTSVLDLTGRQRAERELRRQRDLYEGILTAQSELGEGFVIVEDHNVTYANEAFCEISGYTLEELVGMPSFIGLISEEDRADLLKRRRRRVDTGEGDINYETGLRRKDGRRLDIEVAFKVFEDENPPGFMVVVRDITLRKRAEEDLRKQERRFRRFVEQAADALFVHDLRGDIVDVNQQACASLGYTREELLSMTVAGIGQNMDPGGLAGLWNELISGGPVTMEGVHRRKDGTTFPVEVRIGLLEAEEGRLMLAAARDITERKRSDSALRESEERFRALVQYGSDIITILDADGTIRYGSPSIERIIGYRPEEVVGRNAFATMHPQDAERVSEVFFEALESGRERVSIEFRTRHKDGSWRNLEGIGRNLLDDPAIEGIVVNFRDVTRRKQYEAELQRSNEELEQFAYVASHDLQEPLRMVSSYTQLLARRYLEQLDSDADEFIGYAVDGAERMQQLINDLLSYSRVGTHGKELAPTALWTAVEGATANLRLAIEECGARITSDTLPTVMGDRPQLAQLFQNLIGNAVKFRGKEPPEVHVGAEWKGGEWLISVRDNGIGLEPQYADRVFVIFQRLHVRGKYEGTGIGLAICKRIVERHGGRIWVESAPGEGSTFYFTLSAAGNAAQMS